MTVMKTNIGGTGQLGVSGRSDPGIIRTDYCNPDRIHLGVVGDRLGSTGSDSRPATVLARQVSNPWIGES